MCTAKTFLVKNYLRWMQQLPENRKGILTAPYRLFSFALSADPAVPGGALKHKPKAAAGARSSQLTTSIDTDKEK